jgi:hypothetical protein
MRAVVEGREVRLPDFLIVGAARSGTTSLYNYLKQHPQIFMPDLKEPHFFSFSGRRPHYKYPRELEVIWRFNEYLSLFDGAEVGQLIGEASTQYLYFYAESIRNMKRYVPDWENLKIIIILRNPLERAYSQYSMLRMCGMETLSFEDALNKISERLKNNWRPGFDYIGYSLYYNQVKAYTDNFRNTKAYLYRDLKADALSLLKDMLGFIGADDSFNPDLSLKHHASGISRSGLLNKILKKPNSISSFFPPIKVIPEEKRISLVKKLKSLNFKRNIGGMKEETRVYLKQLFREDVLKLQDIIDRDLTVWL